MTPIAPEIQVFLQLAVGALLVCIAGYVGYHGVQFIHVNEAKIEASLNEADLNTIKSIVALGVQYAEQSGLKGLILNVGSVKKAAALDFIQDALDQLGLTLIDVKALDAMVEAALNQGVHKWGTGLVLSAPAVGEPVTEAGPQAVVTPDTTHGG